MTRRLYEPDWRLLEFDATVLEVRRGDEGTAVALDQSAFYPTGGGQPHDTGTLNGQPVHDVSVDGEGGAVLHWMTDLGGLAEGQSVHGVIDRARRQDHMQQHTGQHLLSQAFVRVADRQTHSFHMGEQLSTIDVDGPLDEATVQQAVALANAVVFDDRPLAVHQVTPDELARFDVRRQTFHGERIRLVEVPDFDVSTCGGTHAGRTGEVGMIVVTGVERVRKLARVSFACGGRALREAQAAAAAAEQAARALSTSRDQVGAQVANLVERSRTQQKRLQQLAGVAAAAEAAPLLAQAGNAAVRCVVHLDEQRSLEELQALARALVEAPAVVALLASAPDGKLLFARSADATVAMGEVMKQTVEQFGGRGGGSPTQAQGAVAADRLGEALQFARTKAGL